MYETYVLYSLNSGGFYITVAGVCVYLNSGSKKLRKRVFVHKMIYDNIGHLYVWDTSLDSCMGLMHLEFKVALYCSV